MRKLVVNPNITISMAKVFDAFTRVPCGITAIDGEIQTSALLVEQNSRMAQRISQLAHTVNQGFRMIGGESAEPHSDDRVRARHLSSES